MIQANLVSQCNGHVVAARVKVAGDKWLLVTKSKCKILLQFTLVVLVVPQPDILILV